MEDSGLCPKHSGKVLELSGPGLAPQVKSWGFQGKSEKILAKRGDSGSSLKNTTVHI